MLIPERLARVAGPSRIDRVRSWLAAEDLDCLIVAGRVRVNHLIGYSRYFGSPAAAVIGADGTRSLIVARDEAEAAQAEELADDVYSYGERGFGLVPDQTPLLADALAAVPEVASASRAGFASELAHLRACLEDLRALPLVDAEAELARIRLVKDEAELVGLERSYELAWTAQETVRTELRAGVMEIELFTSALASAQLAAARPIEFAGDLLSGVRTADVCAPISVAGPVAVKQNDAVISDLVVGCDGYWGDTAATLIAGENEEVAGVAAALFEILDKVAAELVPHRTGAEVYESMRSLIEGAFEGGEFPHHGGHGVRALLLRRPPHHPDRRLTATARDDSRARAWGVLSRSFRSAGGADVCRDRSRGTRARLLRRDWRAKEDLMSGIQFDKVTKRFHETVAVNDLSIEIADGEFMIFVGPSGCGKTTALRLVAGLEAVTSGTIRLGDLPLNDIDAAERDIAMVFQNYALYPHMSVASNIAFPLRMRRRPKEEIRGRVGEAARLLGIEDLLSRKPRQLSGGQRQRVAMGRAIVRHPQAFLMDEPLSNLDAKLRVQMRAELVKLHRTLGVTTIFVTHDQTEAMTLGQRVAVLDKGVMQQVAPPRELYQWPANTFVAGFIGSPPMNFVQGAIESGLLRAGKTRLPLPAGLAGGATTGKVTVGLRPESFLLPSELNADEAGRAPRSAGASRSWKIWVPSPASTSAPTISTWSTSASARRSSRARCAPACGPASRSRSAI